MLKQEDFIEFVLNLDVYSDENEKNFKKMILDNETNTELMKEYFFDKKSIDDFLIFFNDDNCNKEKKEKFIEKLVDMYPLSKKILDLMIEEGKDEKKILSKYTTKNNPFILGMKNYIKSIHTYYENKEEINELKNTLESIETENKKISELIEKIKEEEEKNEELKNLKIKREQLEKDLEALKNNALQNIQKRVKKVEEELNEAEANLKQEENKIKKIEKERDEKNKYKQNIKKKLQEIEKQDLNKEEEELIAKLIKYWPDVD